MRTEAPQVVPAVFVVLSLLVAVVCSGYVGALPPAGADTAAPAEGGDVRYFAIEIAGTLCGYGKLSIESRSIDGVDRIVIEDETFVMLAALGSRFNTEIQATNVVDPTTFETVASSVDIDQGATEVDIDLRVEDDRAVVTSPLVGGEKTIPLEADTRIENGTFYPHVIAAFENDSTLSTAWNVLDVRDAEVHRVTYSTAGRASVEVLGRSLETRVVERVDEATGIRLRMWLDPADASVVRMELPGDRLVYRTDASVVKRIEVADLDPTLVTPAGVAIPDFQRISRMRVRAVLEPVGVRPTLESLNVPGQVFEGTVEGHRIVGTFTIEHPRYDGANAPPFPMAEPIDDELREWLEPGDLIESDDPVIEAHARALTEGATDAWDAVRRISEWVTSEIQYAIPGGGTAKRTLEMRAGECGSHSNLVAGLARAVGIPTRVVWGCMYIPNFGGSFGQHGWNEVWMGEAGWIPIDSTANEVDYVDSGHIRIAEHTSMATALNAVEMEVLEHALVEPKDAASEAYAPFVGAFSNNPSGRTLDVRAEGGGLVAHLSGAPPLTLDDADDAGRWVVRAAPRVYLSFVRDEIGTVRAAEVHERIELRRTGDPGSIDDDVPESARPFLGDYLLPQMNATFVVRYDDGRLAIEDPLANRLVHLDPPDEDGYRIDEFGKNSIRFLEDDASGDVVGFEIDSRTVFDRTGVTR